jgi:hypothetical protein
VQQTALQAMQMHPPQQQTLPLNKPAPCVNGLARRAICRLCTTNF